MSYLRQRTPLAGCHAYTREGLLCGQAVVVKQPVELCAEHEHLGRQDA